MGKSGSGAVKLDWENARQNWFMFAMGIGVAWGLSPIPNWVALTLIGSAALVMLYDSLAPAVRGALKARKGEKEIAPID